MREKEREKERKYESEIASCAVVANAGINNSCRRFESVSLVVGMRGMTGMRSGRSCMERTGLTCFTRQLAATGPSHLHKTGSLSCKVLLMHLKEEKKEEERLRKKDERDSMCVCVCMYVCVCVCVQTLYMPGPDSPSFMSSTQRTAYCVIL